MLLEVGPGAETPPGPRRSRRRDALVLMAVAVLVLAGLAFASASRGGAGDGEAAEETTTTTERRRGTERRRPPRTTTTTTTIPPGPVLGEPVGLTLATIGDGGVEFIDLDTGQTVSEFGGVDWGTAVDGGIVLSSGGRVMFLPAPFDGEAVVLRDSSRDGRQVMVSDQPNRVWIVTAGQFGQRLEEVDLSGNQTYVELDVPGWPAAAVTGGVLVERYGAWYLVEREGDSRQLFQGSLVAAYRDVVAYVACRTLDICELHVLNLTTGADRSYAAPGDEQWGSGYFWGPNQSSGFSPDGRRLVVVLERPARSPTVAVLDLVTGDATVVPIPFGFGYGTAAWSPDGEWLFFASGPGTQWAWRVGAPEAQRMDLHDRSNREVWGFAVFHSAPAAG